MDKNEKWILIKEELISAKECLPEELIETDYNHGSEFAKYLDANELSLALEELEGVMHIGLNPEQKFWNHLENAAKLMNLDKVALYEKYRSAT